MKKPFISVYGIYKNEESCIENFLNSLFDADEVVLCDTGSSDATNTIIDTFRKNHPQYSLRTYKIHISPWRFDDARNTALSLVSRDADICISLDTDEYPEEGWREKLENAYDEKTTRYHHKFRTYWADGSISEHMHERIHSRNGYAWQLPVHEILSCSGKENIKVINDLTICHKPHKSEHRKSYLPLLKQSVKENPRVWKSYSFLANEYYSVSDYTSALAAVDKALELADSDKGFLYKQRSFIYRAAGNYAKALESMELAILSIPSRREIYYEKARLLYMLKRYNEAYFTLLEAEKHSLKITDYHYNANAWGDKFAEFKQTVKGKVTFNE